MKAQTTIASVTLCLALACGGKPAPKAPATGPAATDERAITKEKEKKNAEARFALHGEAAIGPTRHGASTDIGVDVGFESVGCCALGTYFSSAHLAARRNDPDRLRTVLQGGLEGAAVLPWIGQRFRLRLRLGKAGTPPKPPLLGRSGYQGGLTLLFRVTPPKPPAVGDFAPAIDVTAGYTAWTFGPERSSAGSLGSSAAAQAILFGLRIGADYGLDLQ